MVAKRGEQQAPDRAMMDALTGDPESRASGMTFEPDQSLESGTSLIAPACCGNMRAT